METAFDEKITKRSGPETRQFSYFFDESLLPGRVLNESKCALPTVSDRKRISGGRPPVSPPEASESTFVFFRAFIFLVANPE